MLFKVVSGEGAVEGIEYMRLRLHTMWRRGGYNSESQACKCGRRMHERKIMRMCEKRKSFEATWPSGYGGGLLSHWVLPA